jgi:hypothetical protein
VRRFRPHAPRRPPFPPRQPAVSASASFCFGLVDQHGAFGRIGECRDLRRRWPRLALDIGELPLEPVATLGDLAQARALICVAAEASARSAVNAESAVR